jgi:hypothetical protein
MPALPDPASPGRFVQFPYDGVEMPLAKTMSRDSYLTPSHFQQICGFCGCVFRVEITWRTSYSPAKPGSDTQAYSCPECGRDSRIKTSTAPKLTLISTRTDGRTEPFQAR